ncbi:MAG: hypothetical protein ACLT2Z_02060 [Eubacterium sp.]
MNLPLMILSKEEIKKEAVLLYWTDFGSGNLGTIVRTGEGQELPE